MSFTYCIHEKPHNSMDTMKIHTTHLSSSCNTSTRICEKPRNILNYTTALAYIHNLTLKLTEGLN